MSYVYVALDLESPKDSCMHPMRSKDRVPNMNINTYVSIVENPGLLYSHALDYVGCMQIYPRLSKSIVADKQVLKKKYHRKHRSRK